MIDLPRARWLWVALGTGCLLAPACSPNSPSGEGNAAGGASGGVSPGVGGEVSSGAGGLVAGSGGADSSSGGALAAGGSSSSGGASASGGESGSGGSSAEPTFHVFLLIGQSNMAGGATMNADDQVEIEAIKVLGYDDCDATGRVYNEWDVAAPPLHACWLAGIGPGDWFAKTLIEALPKGDTIGLVPVAIPGVDIDFFRKGVVSERRDEFQIPPDDHWDTAYDWLMERAQIAQADGGVIEGIIFHQGESDSGQMVWLDKVEEMVGDLRADLGVGDIPFIAGELLRGGSTEGHNTIIAQLPGRITNTRVVSSEGLQGVDQFHFDAPGVRTLGQRYGEAMIEALGLDATEK